MKAIILAAGIGSRLAPYDFAPKTLTELENGKTLLQMQLDALAQFLPSEKIHIVVGYKYELIEERFPSQPTIKNLYFRSENTAKSLLKAVEGWDDDLLWINGDVVFNPPVLEAFLEQKRTSTMVTVGETDEEAVKYSLDPEGFILELSKEVTEAQGESVGVNFFEKEHLPFLTRGLKQCNEKDYFERGIELAISWGVQVFPFTVDEDQCVEVDFVEDLQRANMLVKKWV